MRNTIITVLLLMHGVVAMAVKVSGIVTDDQGSPLAYASITIKGAQKGTTTNSKGYYAFDLPSGNYIIVAEYVGYISSEKKIQVQAMDIQLDFELSPNMNMMSEVIIQTKGEDPAYRIIRNAIKKRNFYAHQTDSLAVDIYLKGIVRSLNVPDKFFGKKVDRDPSDGLDSAGKGVLLLSESNVHLDEILPDKSKVTVLSSYSRGNNMGLFFSKVTSFYKNNVGIFDLNTASRGYISPIADGALGFYKYKLLNTYNRDGETIKTIRVIPRRRHEPLFSGNIEIVEGSWRIYSLDLTITKEYQLEIIDTLRITQLHGEVVPGIWKTKNQIISIAFNQFGFRGVGSFVNVYSNYNLHPHFHKDYFDNVVMKYDSGYYKRDTAFWKGNRPVTLENDEKRYYDFQDSLIEINKHRSKSYYDSLRRKQKVTLANILWNNQSYHWYSQTHTLSYNLKGLLKSVSYNTVEGIALNLQQSFNYQPSAGKYNVGLKWDMRYGFDNRHFNSFGIFTISNKQFPYRNRYLSIAGGKRILQLNPDNPVNGLTNSLYTLLFRKNYLKIYENWFGYIQYNNRFENGLGVNVNLLYEDRMPLINRSAYSFFNRDKSFTPNHPEELALIGFERHQAVVATVALRYQPGQKYIQYPDRKEPVGSDQPVFTLTYTAGIPHLLGSDVDYHKWNVVVTDNKNLKLAGFLKYRLGVGGFISSKKYSIPDMKHFIGNRMFYNFNYLNSFQLAPYYAYSNVAKFYGEGNVEHHFNGLLTNKIPLFNRLKWNLVIGGNAFYVNNHQYYAEAFAGLENVFKLFRVDFIAGYQPLLKTSFGIRVGLGGLLGNALQFGK